MAIEGEIYPTYFYKDKFKRTILGISFRNIFSQQCDNGRKYCW